MTPRTCRRPGTRPGRAYGKHVAFVFPEENTLYRIRLWAIDESGHVGETEAELRTVDSASAFQATLCLDPSGRFDRMPPGATALTDVAELQDAAIGARGETRVLLARGQTIEDFRLEARMVNFVGAFGDPDLPRPILRARSDKGSMFRFRRLVHPQVTLDGLDCRGEWDASTETGRRTDNPLDFTSSAMAHFTVWDCRFSGFHSIRARGRSRLALDRRHGQYRSHQLELLRHLRTALRRRAAWRWWAAISPSTPRR